MIKSKIKIVDNHLYVKKPFKINFSKKIEIFYLFCLKFIIMYNNI